MTTYTLTRPRFKESITFAHDAEKRLISGPDARLVSARLAVWPGVGLLYGTQAEPAPDPLGSARDMAVFLFDWGWDLPDALTALLPRALPIPEGAVA